MEEMTGVARLRQAIENQRDTGEGEFRLTYHDAEEIDAELLGICSSAVREIGRYAWVHGVPTPVDADGEVVPLNTKKLYTDDGEMIRVNSISFDGYSWDVRNSGSGVLYPINMLHRTKRDSWEKLEEDVQKVTEIGDICRYYDKVDESCDECPAGDIPDLCSAIVLRDVLRRSKALAERDAKEASHG